MPNNDQVFLYMKEEIEREAASQEAKLLKEAQEIRDQAKKRLETEVHQEVNSRFEKEAAALELEYSLKNATDSDKHRQELVELRDGYVETIFEATKAQLLDFTAGDKYEEYLLGKIKDAGATYKFDGAEILVAQKDLKLESKIGAAYGLEATVKASEKIAIGGFILVNPKTNIVVDNSLDFALEDQKEYFAKNSGLIIK